MEIEKSEKGLRKLTSKLKPVIKKGGIGAAFAVRWMLQHGEVHIEKDGVTVRFRQELD